MELIKDQRMPVKKELRQLLEVPDSKTLYL